MVALQEAFDIAAQFFESRCADGDPEVASGNIFQFVRLVEDHNSGVGKDSGVGRALGLLLDSEVGEKQMMIDDDDVTLGCAAAHLGDEALVPRTALLSSASVGAGVELVPQGAGLG